MIELNQKPIYKYNHSFVMGRVVLRNISPDDPVIVYISQRVLI